MQSLYTYTWKKYLPVIRLLIKKSVVAEQTVMLDRIDFEKQSRVRKPACSFNAEINNGRLGIMSPSVAARDLYEILSQDESSRSLLKERNYSISLSSDFMLTIRDNTQAVQAAKEEDLANSEGNNTEAEGNANEA